MTSSKKLLPITLALAVLAPSASAMAAVSNPTADQAMRKGVRDFVRLEADGGRAAKIDIDCRPVSKVGAKGACTGTFQVKVDGRTAKYRLTSKARTFRISPGAIEYRLSAKATKKIAGLPASTDLAGFLQ